VAGGARSRCGRWSSLEGAWRFIEDHGAERREAVEQRQQLVEGLSCLFGDLGDARRAVETRNDKGLGGTDR
jgi:hypothetical protein